MYSQVKGILWILDRKLGLFYTNEFFFFLVVAWTMEYGNGKTSNSISSLEEPGARMTARETN